MFCCWVDWLERMKGLQDQDIRVHQGHVELMWLTPGLGEGKARNTRYSHVITVILAGDSCYLKNREGVTGQSLVSDYAQVEPDLEYIAQEYK